MSGDGPDRDGASRRSEDPRSDGGTDVSDRAGGERAVGRAGGDGTSDRDHGDGASGRDGGDTSGRDGGDTSGRDGGDASGRDGATDAGLPDTPVGRDATDDLWIRTGTSAADDGIPYELDVYAGLLDALLARGYEFVGFDGEVETGEVAIRHDVDISLARAAAMARVEADRGVASTYCLLVTNPLYDLLAPESRRHLRTIVEAGHDVGLHFDPHYYWDEEPPGEDLEAAVIEDRAALESALDVLDAGVDGASATSIHQPPEWTLGVDFDAFECTYRPRYFTDVTYVSDSGGKWRAQPPFADGVPAAMQLLVHPGLWGSEDRPMAAILEEHRERVEERVERYVGPFG